MYYYLSGFEIYNDVVNGIGTESSGLSVLRTFRLLRYHLAVVGFFHALFAYANNPDAYARNRPFLFAYMRIIFACETAF